MSKKRGKSRKKYKVNTNKGKTSTNQRESIPVTQQIYKNSQFVSPTYESMSPEIKKQLIDHGVDPVEYITQFDRSQDEKNLSHVFDETKKFSNTEVKNLIKRILDGILTRLPNVLKGHGMTMKESPLGVWSSSNFDIDMLEDKTLVITDNKTGVLQVMLKPRPEGKYSIADFNMLVRIQEDKKVLFGYKNAAAMLSIFVEAFNMYLATEKIWQLRNYNKYFSGVKFIHKTRNTVARILFETTTDEIYEEWELTNKLIP